MKEKIEEMAKVMCGNDCEECAKETAELRNQTLEEARNNPCLIKICAKTLYKQSYRKIDKDSVVLSRKTYDEIVKKFDNEWQSYCEGEDNAKFYYENIIIPKVKEQERKETAEKIFNYLKVTQVICSPEEVDNFVYMINIKKIVKQLGVEIKE